MDSTRKASSTDRDINSLSNIKTETTTVDNEYQTNKKSILNVQGNILDTSIQNYRQCFSKTIETDTTIYNYNSETDNKIYIKEEPVISDTELSNVEYLDCLNLTPKIKTESISDNDYKMDSKIKAGMQEFVLDIPSQKIKKETFLPSDRAVEKVTTEIDCHSRESLVSGISHSDKNEESDSYSKQNKDHQSSESPRFTSKADYHEVTSHSFPGASAGGENLDVRLNISSYMDHPLCGPDHLESVVNLSNETKHNCNICKRSSSNQWGLNSLLCSQPNLYKCEICEKCFTHKSSLNRHALLHSDTKPYKCEHCDKCFIQKLHLETHKLLHSGEKPFKCAHCEKRFSLKSHLKTHVLIHSGSKPYNCEYCGKSFTQKAYFKAHKLFHSGTKPHRCKHCDKCYTLKSSLNKHILLHSGRNPV